MSNDPNDKILEAFLNELLSEEKPGKRPDQIARAVDSSRNRRNVRRSSPPELPKRKPMNRRQDGRRLQRWKTISVVATILLVGLSVAALVLIFDPAIQQRLRGVADKNTDNQIADDNEKRNDSSLGTVDDDEPDSIDRELQFHLDMAKGQQQPESIQNAEVDNVVPIKYGPLDRSAFVAAKRSELSDRINVTLQNANIGAVNVGESQVNDETWVRRVFERVYGIEPDIQQFDAVVDLVKESGRPAALSWMIQQSEYRSAFVEHWAKSLSIGLGGRPSTFSQNPFGDSLVAYIKQVISEQRSWDDVGLELLSATGKIETNSSDSNSVALVASLLFENGVNREQYAEAFVNQASNQSISCAKCHSEYSCGISQREYWSLQSCFLQLDVRKTNENTFAISNRDANPNPGQTRDDVAMYFEDQDGVMRAAYPPFGELEERRFSGKIKVLDRRKYFAYQVVKSGQWHESVIDEIWKTMLGESLKGRFRCVEGLRNPHFDELHKTLTEQLIADPSIARIVAAIALSDAFVAPESKDSFSIDQHRFATFKSKQNPTSMETLHVLARMYRIDDKQSGDGVLARKFAQTPEYNSIPPAHRAFLESDRPRGKWAAPDKVAQLLDKIEASDISTAQKLNHLFMLAQGRQPSANEMAAMRSVAASSTEASSALSDIWWSLVNSQY